MNPLGLGPIERVTHPVRRPESGGNSKRSDGQAEGYPMARGAGNREAHNILSVPACSSFPGSTVAGGSGDSRQTDPLLYPRSISSRWALHPREDVECRVAVGGTLAAKSLTIVWSDWVSHFSLSD